MAADSSELASDVHSFDRQGITCTRSHSMKPRQEDIFEEFAQEFIRRHAGSTPSWPIGRILVPTDFSLCSLTAVEHAEELALRFAAELILLHAEEILVAGPEVTGLTHGAAERELERAGEQLRSHHVKTRVLLRPGLAVDEILEAAERERASLIVMGTHGRKGLKHMLLGSVAERVVRSAPCPVLTVRGT
jgi:nucleotide-binding universal stress UspA family protein